MRARRLAARPSRHRALRRLHARSGGRRDARRPRGEAAADARRRARAGAARRRGDRRPSCSRSPPASGSPTSRAGWAVTTGSSARCRTRRRSSARASPASLRSPAVDAAGRALAASVLAAAGELVWVDEESMLDAVTGVSGSGPAYVFYFLEALEEAATRSGLRARRRAPARLRHVRRSDGARAGEPAGTGGAARAGHVEGRHHRARARVDGSGCREGSASSPR